MIKKLLPTMIGAALVGGMTTAAADVTVFGHLDTSVDYVDVSDYPSDPPGDVDDINLHCNTCSIGFKGSEDLGNGLKAIFKIDFQFNMTERGGESSSGNSEDTIRDAYGSPTDYGTSKFAEFDPRFGSENDTDSITDRDQWIGLAGGFGQVRIGTISTVYKSHGAMLDPLYRTSLQAREHGLMSNYFHSGAGEEAQGRATNTFRYDSPDFNGFKVGAHYTLDNNEGDGEDDNPFGIGASYSNGGILVFADYITNDGGTNNVGNPIVPGDIDAWKVGGKYTINAFSVMGQYEDASEDVADEDLTQWHVAGSYSMGNNLIYAGYGNAEVEFSGSTAQDTDAWTIALMHSLSKRTKAYMGYNNREDSESDVQIDQFAVGMKHKF